jgi:hypothetical protein
LLGFPIHYLTKVVDAGELLTTTENGVTLLQLDDVLAYRQEFRRQRREALSELARLSQEMGLDDLDLKTVKLKRLAEFDDEPE